MVDCTVYSLFLFKMSMIPSFLLRFTLSASMCIVTVWLLAGCGTKSTTPSPVRIGYIPVTSALPLAVAIEQGYFAEEGITVEAQQFQSSNQLADALLARRLDMDAGTSSFVLAGLAQDSTRLALLRVVLSIEVDSSRWMSRLLVRQDSPIRNVRALSTLPKPVIIGCFPGIAVKTFTRLYMQDVNVWDSGMELTELPPPAQMGALIAGSVQAVMALEPMGSIMIASGQCREVECAPIERHIFGTWSGGYYSFAEEFAQTQPAQAEAILRALHKAVRFIEQSPDSAKQYLKQYAGLTQDQARMMTPLPHFRFPTDTVRSHIRRVAEVLVREQVLQSSSLEHIGRLRIMHAQEKK